MLKTGVCVNSPSLRGCLILTVNEGWKGWCRLKRLLYASVWEMGWEDIGLHFSNLLRRLIDLRDLFLNKVSSNNWRGFPHVIFRFDPWLYLIFNLHLHEPLLDFMICRLTNVVRKLAELVISHRRLVLMLRLVKRPKHLLLHRCEMGFLTLWSYDVHSFKV